MFTQREANLDGATFVKRGLSVANVAVVVILLAALGLWVVVAVAVLDLGERRLLVIAIGLGLAGAMAPILMLVRRRMGETYRLSVQGDALFVNSASVELESIEYGHVSDGGPWEAHVMIRTPGASPLSLRCPQTRVLDLGERMQPIQARRDVLVLAHSDRKTGQKRQSSLP